MRAYHMEASLQADLKRILGSLSAIRQGRVKRVDANSHQLKRTIESLTNAQKHLNGCFLPSDD